MNTPGSVEAPSQYLTFCIAAEEYAVELLRVREILQFEVVTKVPTTPPWIRGVMNLRGSVVPVVDLAAKFGLGESPIGPTTCIVIVEVSLSEERTVMGVMADSVSEVIDLGPEAIGAPPAFGTRVRVDYLKGMGKLDRKLVLILDIERVLSTDELLAAATAAPGEPPGTIASEDQPASPRKPERTDAAPGTVAARLTRRRARGQTPQNEKDGEGGGSPSEA
jgi:purine-binding chemotaxis protein CheW